MEEKRIEREREKGRKNIRDGEKRNKPREGIQGDGRIEREERDC